MTNYFSDVGRAFVRMLNKMAAQRMFTTAIEPAFNWLSSTIDGAIGAGFGGMIGSPASAPTLGSPGVTGPHVFHVGGIAGVTNVPRRIVDASVFDHAERRHTGLNNDEVAAILTKNEVVGTPEQIGGMVSNLAGDGSKGPISVHIHNESGLPLKVTDYQEHMEGEETVISLIVNSLDTNPVFRDAIKRAAMV